MRTTAPATDPTSTSPPATPDLAADNAAVAGGADASRGARRLTRRRLAVGALLAAICAVVAVVLLSGGGGKVSAPSTGVPAGDTTASVTRRTLTESSSVDGTLGYGTTMELYDRLGGTFTWLPSVGATIGRGGTLFRVDNLPVALMYGPVPAYRTLKQGVSDGPDVEELNHNLIALGYDPYGAIVEDARFGEATAAAVRRWQKAEGLRETGEVELGRVIFAPSARRVTTVHVSLGQDPPGGGPGTPANSASSSETPSSPGSSGSPTSTGESNESPSGTGKSNPGQAGKEHEPSNKSGKPTKPETKQNETGKPHKTSKPQGKGKPRGQGSPKGEKPTDGGKPEDAGKSNEGDKPESSSKEPGSSDKDDEPSNSGKGDEPGDSSKGDEPSGSGKGDEPGNSGAAAAGELVLSTTSTQQLVQLKLKAEQQQLAHVGEQAPVTLPGGQAVQGRIIEVGTVASEAASGDESEKGSGGSSPGSEGSGESATIPVTLALEHPVARLDQAPVSVELVKEVRRNVLAVPATALVATAGGGYAIEVLEDDRPVQQPVTPGMFANGYVQVEGRGLHEGQTVIESE